MFYLIRWFIRRLKRRTIPPAEAPAAVPPRDEPAVRSRAARFVSSDPVAASGEKMGTPALSAHGLSKRFGDRVAFENVTFDIGHGEVFGFLGPNGAGKTTTVRTLGTLIAPTSGSAMIAGIPLAPENGVEIRRRISIMPESPGLYLRLSVTENLECFAELYDVPDPGERMANRYPKVTQMPHRTDPGTQQMGGRMDRPPTTRWKLGQAERASRRANSPPL